MTHKTKNACIGDIIRASEFAFGHHPYKRDELGYLVPNLNEKITVDGKTKEQILNFRKPGTPWDKPAEYEQVDLGAYNEKRGKACFVVENAFLGADGEGHGAGDIYPGGWYVEARRLHENGEYNPTGEIIRFHQSGPYNNVIPEVEVVGKMKQIITKPTFVRIPLEKETP